MTHEVGSLGGESLKSDTKHMRGRPHTGRARGAGCPEPPPRGGRRAGLAGGAGDMLDPTIPLAFKTRAVSRIHFSLRPSFLPPDAHAQSPPPPPRPLCTHKPRL